MNKQKTVDSKVLAILRECPETRYDDSPVLRIERGTGLFPFLAILSNTFDALYAGRTFVFRGIGR